MDYLETITLDGFEILDSPMNIEALLGHSTQEYQCEDLEEDPFADLPDLIPFDDAGSDTDGTTSSWCNSPIDTDDLNLDEVDKYIQSSEDLRFAYEKLSELENIISTKLSQYSYVTSEIIDIGAITVGKYQDF
jgi:hypothetical protein